MDGFVPALTVPRIPSFIEGLAQHTQSTKKKRGARRGGKENVTSKKAVQPELAVSGVRGRHPAPA